MTEELRPCPFCGAMPEKLRTGYMCSTLGCALQENTVSEKEWNTRPIEDELQSRIAELEKDLSNKEIEYTDLWDDALALQARIAELEADNAELKERVAMLDVTAVYKSLGEMGYIGQVANLKAENAALQARIAELEDELKAGDEGYAYWLVDSNNEIRQLKSRIAELEADNKKAFDLVRKLRMYCIWANWDNPDTEDEFNEFDVEVCKWLSKFMESAE